MKNFNKKTSSFGCFIFTICITTQVSAMNTERDLRAEEIILGIKKSQCYFIQQRILALPASASVARRDKLTNEFFYATQEMEIQKEVVEEKRKADEARKAADAAEAVATLLSLASSKK